MPRRFDLPDRIALFPLPGAVLMPRARLPLHIFEPRYLQMIEDTLKTGHRLIGVQVVRRRDRNDVDIWRREQVLKTCRKPRVRKGQTVGSEALSGARLIASTQRHNAAVWIVRKGRQMLACDPSHPNETHAQRSHGESVSRPSRPGRATQP